MRQLESKVIEDDHELHEKDHPVECLPQGVLWHLEFDLYLVVVGRLASIFEAQELRRGRVGVLDLLLRHGVAV